MDPLEGQIRQVYFFDTPDLALFQQGVVARARRVQKKGDDSVVKLRPIVPKCEPASAFDVAARTRAFLLDRGVNLSGEQQTKTRTALEFFSKQASAKS